MAVSEKIGQLMIQLQKQTSDRKLSWKVSPANDKAFRAYIGGVHIRVEHSNITNGEDFEEFRKLSIFDMQDQLIEEYTPKEESEIELFDAMYLEAKRSNYDVENIIDRILHLTA